MCVCGLRYHACNARAPYCRLWPAWLYNIFPHCLINGTIFEKKKYIDYTVKYVFWFSLQLVSETFLITRRTEGDIHWTLCKVTAILVRFWWNLKFHDRLSKSTQISSIMKIRPVGAELFHTESRRTDVPKLMVASRNLMNAPKMVTICVFSNFDAFFMLGIWSSEITLIPTIVVWLFYRYCLFDFSI